MAVALLSFLLSFILYLSLTAGSGSVLGMWSVEEIAASVLVSALASVLSWRLFKAVGVRGGRGFLSPARWALFAAYAAGPFLWGMAKANVDVAGRVITGRIRPGIVKVPTGLKTDFGLAFLANSITLTPGTLSVDADDERNLYVHCINLGSRDPGAGEVCGPFLKWTRRITE